MTRLKTTLLSACLPFAALTLGATLTGCGSTPSKPYIAGSDLTPEQVAEAAQMAANAVPPEVMPTAARTDVPATPTSTRSPTFISTMEGCQIYDPFPKPGETASWSGPCVEGVANGRGTVTWTQPDGSRSVITGELVGGKAVDEVAIDIQTADGTHVTGTQVAGRLQGRGEVHKPDGTTFIGNYSDGKPNGEGTYTTADGESISGTWRNGCFTDSDGHYGVVGTTLEACRNQSSSFREAMDNASGSSGRIGLAGLLGGVLGGLAGAASHGGPAVVGSMIQKGAMLGATAAARSEGVSVPTPAANMGTSSAHPSLTTGPTLASSATAHSSGPTAASTTPASGLGRVGAMTMPAAAPSSSQPIQAARSTSSGSGFNSPVGNAGAQIPAECQGWWDQAMHGDMSASYKAASCLEVHAARKQDPSGRAFQALGDAARQNAKTVQSLESPTSSFGGDSTPPEPATPAADDDGNLDHCPDSWNVCGLK